MTWQPMHPATKIISERTRKFLDAHPEEADRVNRSEEMWMNDRYTVTVYRFEQGDYAGQVQCLSIRRNDRGAVRDWRHMQQIKNELAGEDVEAFQIFPAKGRTVDAANQTWLWCLPKGVLMPLGFDNRATGTPEEAAEAGARQRPFEEGLTI